MDQMPLVMEEIEAGRRFALLFNRSITVDVAFWLKVSNAGQRYFYLASHQITENNFDFAHREVLEVGSMLPSLFLHPLQIKVLSAQKPLARAALELNEEYPTKLGTRLDSCPFGGTYTHYGYVYPDLRAQPSPELVATPSD